MIRASIYGRLGADPIERQTRNGKAMATANLAVNAGRPDQDDITEWFNLISFGKVAETLMRHFKGDLISVMGELSKSRFTGQDGQERENWSLKVDSILSAQTVRPGGKKKKPEPSPAPADVKADAESPFDDPIPSW